MKSDWSASGMRPYLLAHSRTTSTMSEVLDVARASEWNPVAVFNTTIGTPTLFAYPKLGPKTVARAKTPPHRDRPFEVAIDPSAR